MEARLSCVPGMDQLVLGKRDLLWWWGVGAPQRLLCHWSHWAGLVKRGGSALSRGLGARASCLAMDFLCQEMRDACWVSSESVGSLCSLWSQCQKGSLANCHSNKSLSLTVDGRWQLRRGMWSEKWREMERERRALLSCVGLSVSFEFRHSLNMVCF